MSAEFDHRSPAGFLTQIDHVGIAVRDLDAAVEEYRAAFGVEPVHRELVEDQGVEEAMFAVGASYIQLLGATGPDTPVGKFLERRGEGMHHVGYRVDDLEVVLAALKAVGVPLIERTTEARLPRHDGRVRASEGLPRRARGAGAGGPALGPATASAPRQGRRRSISSSSHPTFRRKS